jgi:hypothetical protein
MSWGHLWAGSIRWLTDYPHIKHECALTPLLPITHGSRGRGDSIMLVPNMTAPAGSGLVRHGHGGCRRACRCTFAGRSGPGRHPGLIAPGTGNH